MVDLQGRSRAATVVRPRTDGARCASAAMSQPPSMSGAGGLAEAGPYSPGAERVFPIPASSGSAGLAAALT